MAPPGDARLGQNGPRRGDRQRSEGTCAALRAEQTRVLYRQLPLVVLLNTIVPPVVAVLTWPQVGVPVWLAAWTAAILAANLGRIVLWMRFRQIRPGDAECRRWALYATIAAGLNGALWGIACLAFMPADSTIDQLAWVAVILAISSASMAGLSARLEVYYVAAAPMLLPLAAAFLLRGDTVNVALGLLTLVYAGALALFARNIHAALRQSLALQFDKDKLLQTLALAQDDTVRVHTRLIHAIENISVGLILFDAENRVILGNSRFNEFFPFLADLNRPGTPYRDILLETIRRGLFPEAQADPEAWIARRLDPERLNQDREYVLGDGRCFQVWEAPSSDGGTVSVWADVTDARRRETALSILVEASLKEESFLESVVQAMAVRAGYRWAGVALHREGGEVEVVAFWDGERPGAPFRYAMAGAPCERVLATGRVCHYSAGASEMFPDAPLLRQRGVEAYHGRVFTDSSGEVVGHLFAMNDRPDRGPQATPDMFRLFALWVGIELERQRAEEAYRESERRFQSVASNMPGLVVQARIAPDGGIAFPFLSAGARDLLDVDPEEGMENPDAVLERLYPEDRDSLVAAMQRSRQTLEPCSVPFRVTRPDGRNLRWLRMVSRPFRDGGGDTVFDGLILDITEQKRAQLQLMQTSKLATLGEIAAGVAHELNQPLNVIRMAADNCLITMETGEDDPEYNREQFTLISGQTERMGQIINHLRQFSRLEPSSVESFDPRSCLDNALTLLRRQFELDGIAVVTSLPATRGVVTGRANQLEQVLINLFTNARDAIAGRAEQGRAEQERAEQEGTAGSSSQAGPLGVRGTIRVAMTEDEAEGLVRIAVSDTGGGIPVDIIDRIFDPFFTTKDVGKGTGLGLSISYSIVTAMHGRIEVRNTGEGSSFLVVLPARFPTIETGELADDTGGGAARAAE